MGVQAEWSGMRWEISPDQIKPLESIAAKRSVSVERNEEKEGEPATQTVAFDLMTIDVDYTVNRGATGEDPRSVYGAWWRLVGTYAPFYLGGRKFLGDLFLLTSADCSDIIMDGSGNFQECKITLKFEEYAQEASGLKAQKGAATDLKPGIFEQTATSAVGVGPSTSQAAGKIPTTAGL